MGEFTFSKAERLSKEKDIQELFQKGSSFYLFPFKVLFLTNPEFATTNQVLISVSKRNFKTAVSRNMIKRRIREAYRLNKALLAPATSVRIGFIYTHKEILPTPEIFGKMVHVLKRISHLCEKKTS
ncbi:MAG TPA: ribonuclease P protein component [Ohtaekwangia sp.]|nr:ribonuclease P protein component [Ohtaekwangia sp.]